MFDERLVGESGAGLLADGVNIVGSEGLDGIELIAILARVNCFDNRPG